MGRTQKDVKDELARLGIAVTRRRLTDWHSKGLLPDMTPVRDARGRLSYVWNQANIVEQAVEVWGLFDYFGRTERFAHILWLLGYEARPDIVMEGIRAPVVGHWQFWSGGAPTDELLFDDEQKERLLDKLDELAQKMTRRRERRPADYPDFS